MIALRASALSAVFIDCFNSLSFTMKTFRNILLFAFALTAIRMGPEILMNVQGAIRYADQCEKRGFDWKDNFTSYPGLGFKGSYCS